MGFAQTEAVTPEVAFVADDDNRLAKELIASVQAEIRVLSRSRNAVQCRAARYANNNLETMRALVESAMTDEAIQCIVGYGLLFVKVINEYKSLPKPVIVGLAPIPDVLGLPKADGVSGKKNLYYVTTDGAYVEDVKAVKRVVQASRIHVVVGEKAAPFLEVFNPALAKEGITVEYVLLPKSDATAEDILSQVEKSDVNALYVTGVGLSRTARKQLFSLLADKGVPAFSMMGYADVVDGALGALVAKYPSKYARRVALSLDRILRGEDAGSLPVRIEMHRKLVVNQRTAIALKLSLPFDVLMDAEVLHRGDVAGDMLTMKRAVALSLENNWNFRVADEAIDSAEKEHLLQWTNYLPQVMGNLNYNIYDTERARHYSANFPKREMSYGVGLDQLIFSDPVIRQIIRSGKQVSIEKLQKDIIELDITEQTVKTYLLYLRSKALLNVELANKAAIEGHLEVAEKRRKLGKSGPEEVLRWTSELAEKKSDIIKKESEVHKVRVTLNQLMNRDLEQDFKEVDVGLEMVDYYLGSNYLGPYIYNLDHVRTLLDYFVHDAVSMSPSLGALDYAIEQQDQQVKAAGGRFILPEVRMTGDLERGIHDKRYGAPPTDSHDDWSLKFKASYPLFDRGQRPLDFMKQRSEMRRLEFKAQLKMQELDRDLRAAAYDIHHSLQAIALRQEAMASSTDNYNIVLRKYEEGLASITDLLNARNDKFRREGNAVIAVYTFLYDLATFDRSMSAFTMLAEESDRELWLAGVKEYLSSKGLI